MLADLPPRTVRYYVQIGLVDRPQGETRAARYGASHLEQLLLIKKWTAAGLSLERIRELLHGGSAPVPPRAPAMGSVSVRSHLMVADGIEVVIDPGLAGLSPEQVRHFTLGQYEYNYSFLNRTSMSDANGLPELATAAECRIEVAGERLVDGTAVPARGAGCGPCPTKFSPACSWTRGTG